MNVDCEANKQRKKIRKHHFRHLDSQLNLKNKNIKIYIHRHWGVSSEANLLAMCKQCLAFWSVKHSN